MKDSLIYVAPLNDLSVIQVTGADAASFLHSQLTHDVTGLAPHHARLAGFCTAKGRLLGTLIFWRTPDEGTPTFQAMVKADIAEPLVKRLSMFVLRAKAKISITNLKPMGIAIQSTTDNATSSVTESPKTAQDTDPNWDIDITVLPSDAACWTTVQTHSHLFIAAPSNDASISRWWAIPAPASAPQPSAPGAADAGPETGRETGPGIRPEAMPDNDAANLPTLGAPVPVGSPDHTDYTAQWQAADIAAGLPWVVGQIQDLFIPQTLNLDLIDGVSFTKGCYPGQEVVARSHYRGTVKRRMAYGVVDEAPPVPVAQMPALDIFDASKPENPCGRIINAAQTHQTHLLLEVQLSDIDVADFRLGDGSGPVITLRALPYSIKADD